MKEKKKELTNSKPEETEPETPKQSKKKPLVESSKIKSNLNVCYIC